MNEVFLLQTKVSVPMLPGCQHPAGVTYLSSLLTQHPVSLCLSHIDLFTFSLTSCSCSPQGLGMCCFILPGMFSILPHKLVSPRAPTLHPSGSSCPVHPPIHTHTHTLRMGPAITDTLLQPSCTLSTVILTSPFLCVSL